jgi:hypothetical protein
MGHSCHTLAAWLPCWCLAALAALCAITGVQVAQVAGWEPRTPESGGGPAWHEEEARGETPGEGMVGDSVDVGTSREDRAYDGCVWDKDTPGRSLLL